MECTTTGKLRIDNKPLAELILEQLKRKGRKERNIYRCPHCGNYHFTSQEKRS